MVGSQARPVRLRGSFGRTRISLVTRLEAGRCVEGRWGRYEVQYVWVAPLPVSSVFVVPGETHVATELLGTLVKTLTGSFQSLLVSRLGAFVHK